MVAGRSDGVGHPGVGAVGAEHDPGSLVDGSPVAGVAADPDDPAVVDDQLVERDALPDLGAGVAGGVDEQGVEHVRRGQYAVAHAIDRAGLPAIVIGPKSNE